MLAQETYNQQTICHVGNVAHFIELKLCVCLFPRVWSYDLNFILALGNCFQHWFKVVDFYLVAFKCTKSKFGGLFL